MLYVLLRLTERMGLSLEIEVECLKDNPMSWVNACMIKTLLCIRKKREKPVFVIQNTMVFQTPLNCYES